jgi:Mg2+ and Co2+ transporter CorA
MEAIIVAVLSCAGTAIGSIAGILTSNKLVNYRITQLEIKMDKHNSVQERVALLEQSVRRNWDCIQDLQNDVEEIKKEVYKLEQ